MSNPDHAVAVLEPGQFPAFVGQSEGLSLVDFWAPWCGPCRAVAPVLERLAGELSDQVRIGKINVDEASALAARLGVRSIPTLILFRNGVPVAQSVGAQSDEALRAWIQQHA